MLNNKLRQLAICTTDHGVIGAEGKLLFASAADMSRFAAFTKGTALILGRTTAQEMVVAGAHISRLRPMVVISESGCLEGTTNQDDKWVYYAKSLKEAMGVADAITLELNLNGWTIGGGKQVYDELFDLMATKSLRLNHVYAFTHSMNTDGLKDVVKLSRDWNDLEKLIDRSMVTPFSVWQELDVMGRNCLGDNCRTTDPRITYIHDRSVINPDEVIVQGHSLVIKTDGGSVVINRNHVAGWQRKDQLNAVDISMNNGIVVNVRPKSTTGLNSLLFALNLSSLS